VSSLTIWWTQPDRFDWTTKFLRERGLLRPAQRVMAIVSASSTLVTVTCALGPITTRASIVYLATAVFTVGMAAFWLTRWPTRRQSLFAILVGVMCTAAWSVSQPSTVIAALACAAMALTGGYIAFFHSPKILVFNLSVATLITMVAAARLVRESGLQTAVAAFWVIWFLNMTVPLAIWGTSQAMGRYAMRSDEDPLTGLLNRRGFIEATTRQLAAPDPGVTYLTVQMVDLDDFKRVNDTLGHAAGDRVLTAVAELLRSHAPPTAAVCRAGGEEFLIAAMSVSAKDGTAFASRLCAAISGLSHSVTASIGSATATLDGERAEPNFVESLIEAADMAMYAAKRNGGNQVQHA
jgi:diguanylate cyclase (GGDEF)-like protein